MADPAQFSGRPTASGSGAALVVVFLVVASIGLAVVKPWDQPAPPPTTAAASAIVLIPSPTPGRTVSASPPGSAPPPASAATPSISLDGFTLASPSNGGAPWTGVRWRSLDVLDPLAHLGTVVRWWGGYASVGDDALGGSRLWTSPDGSAWSAVGTGTAATFWPGLAAFAVAPLGRRLFALTVIRADAPSSTSAAGGPGVVAWASSDGASWAPIGGATFPVPLDTAGPPLIAGSETSLVLAWNLPLAPAPSVRPARVAVTTDGVAWHPLPETALPVGFVVTDIAAAPGGGFLAAGQVVVGADATAAILRSNASGTVWSPVVLPQDPTVAAADRANVVWATFGGASGAVATGSGPAGVVRWQSPDGRRWTNATGLVPGGAAPCSASTPNCSASVPGLIGGDGVRLVAVGGTAAGPGLDAWVSPDGLTWQSMPNSGAVPTGPPTVLSLMSGGLVLTTSAGAWYGEASIVP